MEIKDITIELSTKNIIVTYLDDRGYTTKKGFTSSNLGDWEELEKDAETAKVLNCFWGDLERPKDEFEDYEEVKE